MKNYFVLITICFFTAISQAQTTGEVIDSFFEALNSKDHQKLDALCLDDIQIHSLSLGDETILNFQSKKGFIDGVKSIPEEMKIFEKIVSKDSIVTKHLAQYTLPYSFYVNDQLSHKGTNVMTLLKTENDWKISYIADTRLNPR